jgi:hypothetical protein
MKSNVFLKRFVQQAIAVIFFFLLVSCSSVLSVTDWAKAWVGEDFSRVQRASLLPGYLSKNGLSITQRSDENGKRVYVDPQGPNCSVIWIVNSQNKVENFKLEGEGCW